MSDLNVAIRIGATVQGSVPRTVGGTVRQLERIKRAERDLAAIQARRAARQSRLIGATALGVAVLGPIVGATRAAIRFESVMADVQKVVDFDTPEQFAEMGRDILKLSERIPVAASGLGDIVAAAGQAGIARGELTRFAEDAAKMAVAFDISGAEAGSSMTGLRNIFKASQDEVMMLAGTVNHLSNNMDATAPAMLNVMERAGGMATLFGLTGQETAALAGSFLALKTRPEVAATGINAMLRIMADAPNQSRKFHDALDELGMSAEELKEDIEHDAQGALLNLLTTIGQAEDKIPILSALFGAEYADDIAKLAGNLDIYRGALQLAGDETAALTSIEKEYQARAATTANNLQLLKNRANVLGVNIGNVLLPTVNDAVGAIGGLVGKAAALAQQFPGATKVVIGLVGGVTALAVGGAFAGYAATFLAEGWVRGRIAMYRAALGAAWLGRSLNALSLRAVPTAIRGAGLLRLALLSTGIGAIVVGLGMGAALIVKYWDHLGAFFTGFGEGIWKEIEPMFAPLAPLFGWLGDVLGWIGDMFGSLLTPIAATEEELESFRSTGQSVGKIVGAVFGALTFPIRQVIKGVGWVLKSLGMIGEADVEAGIGIMDEKPPAARQDPVKQAAAAAVVGAAVAATAPAPAPEAMPVYPAAPVATADAPAAGGSRGSPDAIRAQAERDFADLAARGEAEAVPLAGAQPGFRAAQPGAAQGASLVFHQTFNFQGAGPEIEDEIARRMEIVMRRASVEAGLVEAEDAF